MLASSARNFLTRWRQRLSYEDVAWGLGIFLALVYENPGLGSLASPIVETT